MSFCLSLSGFSASNSSFLFLSLSSFIDLFVVGAVFCLVLVSLVLEICFGDLQSCPCFLCRWSLTTTHPGRPDHAHLRVLCKDGCSWACRSLTTTHPVCPDHAFPMVVVQGWSLLTPPRSAQAGPVGG